MSLHKRKRTGCRGWTLVELLTVLAIIAILAALLAPVFLSVRARAKLSVCTSQLHQVGVVCTLYANDNNGQLPVDGIVGVLPHQTRAAWNALTPYFRDSRIIFCPASAQNDLTSLGYFYRAGYVKLGEKTRRTIAADPTSVLAYCLDHTQTKETHGAISYTDYVQDATGHFIGPVSGVRADTSAFHVDGKALETWVFAEDGHWYPIRDVPKNLDYTSHWERFPGEPWPPQFQP